MFRNVKHFLEFRLPLPSTTLTLLRPFRLQNQPVRLFLDTEKFLHSIIVVPRPLTQHQPCIIHHNDRERTRRHSSVVPSLTRVSIALMWGGGGPPYFGGHYDDEFAPRAAAAPDDAFTRQFRCYPVSFIDRPDLELGDKIVLPPSALDTLTRLNITFPMLFKLTSREGRSTHCGVQEFVAEEGHANLPYWLMQNLLVAEGAMITISNVNLPKGTFVKFQPQSSDFLKISNPKAVLEATLRTFTCLTTGDTIAITYNDKAYYIDVLQVAPGNAISIIETDVNVEFEAPADYVEPTPNPPAASKASSANASKKQIFDSNSDLSARIKERLEKFKKRLPTGEDSDSSSGDEKPPPKPTFPGSGQTLKARTSRSNLTFPPAPTQSDSKESEGEQPKEQAPEKDSFVPFGGEGRSLR